MRLLLLDTQETDSYPMHFFEYPTKKVEIKRRKRSQRKNGKMIKSRKTE